ncbi:hypothetical protein F5144DRAFT_506199 [Chaetomium tenue]|uniref:Uncharacterized protein n=1 Tax=Chaetomium tenue TaxID=1854479 RepID=A0ACB7PLC2_9PEZI|nr:hypothetical protein F5144DRAFT_506199 [Chaetomium globosum]
MASSSSDAPLLGGFQGYELKVAASDRPFPWAMRYMFTIFKLFTRVFAVWGLISLGLEASKVLHKMQSSEETPHVSPFSPPPHLDQISYKIDVYRPATLPPGLNLCDCGSTIREARSRGCIYDTLSTAWLPPYCRDGELTAEFDNAGPGPEGSWEYFADKEGKVALDLEQVAALGETGGSFWASRDWHIVHCLFYWQKYVRMRTTNIVMEERFDSLHHVKHCTRLIRNPVPDHFFLIEVPVTMNSSKDV